jgi:osmotically-inducible protein OsmY
MWTDDRIYVDIVTALERELGLMGRNIAISIADGVVTLNGHVGTQEEKGAAERAVASVRGVRALADGVHVIGEPVQPLTDTMIAHAIVAAIDTIPDRPDVFARVEHGWVTLSGSASAASYEIVEQALECVPGVRGIASEVLTSGVLT